MNVSSISTGSTASSTTAFSNDNNNQVKVLEKQKAALEKELEKVKESKLDEKTKKEEVQLIQQQITEIEQEIQQAKNKSQEKAISGSSESYNGDLRKKSIHQEEVQYNEGIILSGSLKDLITAEDKGPEALAKVSETAEKGQIVEIVA